LHQLRGRIGRGNEKSHCMLIYQRPLSNIAKERLEIMRTTNNGFVIAEKDLELRGPGEVLGTRQAGIPDFRIANLKRDSYLLPKIQKIAIQLLKKNPNNVKLLIRRWLGGKNEYSNV
ncbi:MAG: ATP-dependent DNA helicase RecG, partial [Pseudomonadota bacterium]|nr:ATP-dependent DNA helicase RecG [Pseudomonadota bacterium]